MLRVANAAPSPMMQHQPAQCRDDAIVAIPVARRTTHAATHRQIARLLRYLGIELVHQDAQRRLGEPRLRRDLRPCGALMVRILLIRPMLTLREAGL